MKGEMKAVKLILVAGARPNFMKVAPLMKEIAAHNRGKAHGTTEVGVFLVHTGQHYDEKMSDIFFPA